MSSTNDVDSSHSLKKPPEGIMVKYLRYKDMCEELTEENLVLKQEKLDISRKYDAMCLNVADLESYNSQMWIAYSKLNSALKEQKIGFDSNMKALQAVMDETYKKLSETKRDLNLSMNVDPSDDMSMESTLSTCELWWCPKHSDLVTACRNMEITSLKDKTDIELALGRQKFWCKDNEIRCVLDCRMETLDRYSKPPDCWVQYKEKQKLVSNAVTTIQPDRNSNNIHYGPMITKNHYYYY